MGAGVEPRAWPRPHAGPVDQQISNSGNELQQLPVIDLLFTASFCLPILVQIPPLAHTDLKDARNGILGNMALVQLN